MKTFENFYNKNHKKLLIIPALLILFSLIYLGYFYSQNHDIIKKDVTLTGGTTISFLSDIPAATLQSNLSSTFSDISVSAVSDNTGKQTGLVVTVPGDNSEQVVSALQQYIGYNLTNENSSVEFTGSSLGNDFYIQLLKAVAFAFLLMALVVFIVFGESKKTKVYSVMLTLIAARLTFPLSRFLGILIFLTLIITLVYGIYLSKTKKDFLYILLLSIAFFILFFFPVYYLIFPIMILLFSTYAIVSVPSMAVIFSAFIDILIPLAIVDLVGMKISSAGIVAFLMLIGYSVDTDILLTTRVLRRKQESVNSSIWGAFKTGTTMTITSLVAVSVALIVVYGFGSILNQIFTILIIGLAVDLLSTWVMNASLIKWYVSKSL